MRDSGLEENGLSFVVPTSKEEDTIRRMVVECHETGLLLTTQGE